MYLLGWSVIQLYLYEFIKSLLQLYHSHIMEPVHCVFQIHLLGTLGVRPEAVLDISLKTKKGQPHGGSRREKGILINRLRIMKI